MFFMGGGRQTVLVLRWRERKDNMLGHKKNPKGTMIYNTQVT